MLSGKKFVLWFVQFPFRLNEDAIWSQTSEIYSLWKNWNYLHIYVHLIKIKIVLQFENLKTKKINLILLVRIKLISNFYNVC